MRSRLLLRNIRDSNPQHLSKLANCSLVVGITRRARNRYAKFVGRVPRIGQHHLCPRVSGFTSQSQRKIAATLVVTCSQSFDAHCHTIIQAAFLNRKQISHIIACSSRRARLSQQVFGLAEAYSLTSDLMGIPDSLTTSLLIALFSTLELPNWFCIID